MPRILVFVPSALTSLLPLELLRDTHSQYLREKMLSSEKLQEVTSSTIALDNREAMSGVMLMCRGSAGLVVCRLANNSA